MNPRARYEEIADDLAVRDPSVVQVPAAQNEWPGLAQTAIRLRAG